MLPAFDKIGTSFGDVDPENPESIELTSKLLKGILCSLPRVRAPVKDLLSIVNLKKAAEGKKDIMWNDPERYPAIIDSDMSLQAIEVELMDELKSSMFFFCVLGHTESFKFTSSEEITHALSAMDYSGN